MSPQAAGGKHSKGEYRETVRLFRECSLGRAKLSGAELPMGSAPQILYFAPPQVFTAKLHFFCTPSSSTAPAAVTKRSGHTMTGPSLRSLHLWALPLASATGFSCRWYCLPLQIHRFEG